MRYGENPRWKRDSLELFLYAGCYRVVLMIQIHVISYSHMRSCDESHEANSTSISGYFISEWTP